MFGDGVVVHSRSRRDDDVFVVAGFQVDGVKSDTAASDASQFGAVFDDSASVRLGTGDHG